MVSDYTQRQSNEEQQQAKDLSLQHAQPPTEVPGYELQHRLGNGAYGEVWVGVDCTTRRKVAVKFYFHRRGLDWSLLDKETEKLVFLSADRYVVQLLDVGWDADPPYYVMEYVENGSLDDCLAERGTLPVEEAVEIFREVAVGLSHAHGKGVLHCDVKPANVLLDADSKPRLADFGQSRLSHEQSPALGTLFYMAPEQANLSAVPDVQWDIYALGAILYCMLEGHPPFRTQTAVARIAGAESLTQRLAIYQDTIQATPAGKLSFTRGSIDHALQEIIARCLAVEPDVRYATVQELLHDVSQRSRARNRKPLVIVGLVGPILLLIIMLFFGWQGYQVAKEQSTNAIRRRAYESNLYAAESVAKNLENEIEKYFDIVERESDELNMVEAFRQTSELDYLEELGHANIKAERRKELRSRLINEEVRIQLRDYLIDRLNYYRREHNRNPKQPKFASIFIVDRNGTLIAVAYEDGGKHTKSTGQNYAFRTYFHGATTDIKDRTRRPCLPGEKAGSHDIHPIEHSHFSTAFQSTTTKIWKVGVSTPLGTQSEFGGVMVFTVEAGDFEFVGESSDSDEKIGKRSRNKPNRFSVLIDKEGAGKAGGALLQHPLLASHQPVDGLPSEAATQSIDVSLYPIDREVLAVLESIDSEDLSFQYSDPLAEAPDGDSYQGAWIAAIHPVEIPHSGGSNADAATSTNQSNLIVLVQEREDQAIAPVVALGDSLEVHGLRALMAVGLTAFVLFYFVTRFMETPHSGGERKVERAEISPASEDELANKGSHSQNESSAST